MVLASRNVDRRISWKPSLSEAISWNEARQDLRIRSICPCPVAQSPCERDGLPAWGPKVRPLRQRMLIPVMQCDQAPRSAVQIL